MNNIKALRELKGLKQAALARELNVKNQASISEWETGRKGLSVENAIMFARYFDVTVGCIVGTEPIPDGYPAGCSLPEIRKVVQKAEKRPENKLPFSNEQMAFLNEWKSSITEEIVAALKEDTSSSNEQGSGAS